MPTPTQPPRYAPAIPLPPYAYVPGHELPHPINDPRGHSFGHAIQPTPTPLDLLNQLPTEPASRRQAIAALFATHPDWHHALDLFNAGYPWEAHESWEAFWHALGRTTPDARFVQGFIHLAAACVKIREGKPAGVTKHTQRARELLGGAGAADVGRVGAGWNVDAAAQSLGLDPASLVAVLAELDAYRTECWHVSRFPVVKVVTSVLELDGNKAPFRRSKGQ